MTPTLRVGRTEEIVVVDGAPMRVWRGELELPTGTIPVNAYIALIQVRTADVTPELEAAFAEQQVDGAGVPDVE